MFFDEILKIGDFIFESFLHIWPYLVVTIPLAVAIQMSGAAQYIKRAFAAKPFTAITLATVVGAFSPFCSCGVIPVIASLMISGVPLAPVMSFWIASPSMDPEIFFFKCRADRMGAGSLAPGRHAAFKLWGRPNHTFSYGKRLAGSADIAYPRSCFGAKYI